MRRRWMCTLSAAICVAAFGCGQRPDSTSEILPGPEPGGYSAADMAQPQQRAGMDVMAKGAEDGASPSSLDSMAQSSANRQIIRNGLVTLEAADARKAAQTLTDTVRRLGGFVGSSSEEVNELGGRTITMEARVPAAKFDELTKGLDALGTVLSRNVTTQDVTEEYVDVEAKLRNLKRTEERLLAHLSRSGKLSDTLLVERELTRVREQIEQHDGRMRYLKHNVAFSSATVTIRDRARKEPMVPPESFSSGQVASSAVRSLVGFARSIWAVLIWFGVWSPVWLPVLVLLVYQGRRRRPKTPNGPSSTT